jgi:aminodeoxyfutalosine deaminase
MILRARGVLPIAQPLIEDGAVVITGDRIQEVGPWAAVRQAHGEEGLDLGDVLILPGLVNAHCHLDYTDMAGLLSRPTSFPNWIKELVTLKATWGYSEYACSWLHGAAMLLRHGTTTVADIESVPDLLPEVWQSTPLQVISCLELLNVRSWHSAREILRDAEARLQSLPAAKGRTGLSPHAPYTTSPELLRQAAESSRHHAWLLTTHVAESREEFDMFTRRQGALFDWLSSQRDVSACGLGSPVRFLARQGVLGPNFVAVHVNYLAEGDARLLADHQASVAHCPRSHAFFRHDRFPLHELSAAGVNLCLGTDSLASVQRERRQRIELDLFAEMRALAAREPELSAETIVRMATVNGARALGLEGQIGELKPGAQADLIAIPFRHQAKEPYEATLSHQGGVTASMIGGKWVISPPSAS